MSKSRLESILPLSPLQEGLLFHALYDDQSPDVYVVQLALEFEGNLDSERLHAAADAVLNRHANLRAGFRQRRQQEGQPVQLIAANVKTPWRLVDLRDHDVEEQTAVLERAVAEEKARRFDMARPPLIRFTLFRLAEDRFVLLLTAHHILLDGWSMPLLMRELFELYGSGGDDAVLPRVAPYRDYLSWLAARDRETGKAAWAEALSGLEEPCHLASAGTAEGVARPEQITRMVSAELTGALQELARSRGLTMNTLVQGAWGVLLGALTSRDDVVFGTTVSGRPPELPGIESMVGLFINTVPVRIRLDSSETVLDLLTRIQRQQTDLLDHQYLSLAEIQQTAGIGELFDTTTVFENYPLDTEGFAGPADGLRLIRAEGDDATHYPLSLAVLPGRELQLKLGYRPDLFDREAVEEIASRFVAVLRAMVADPELWVGRIDLLSDDERQRLLVDWNPPGMETVPGCVPEVFEQKAAQTPDAVAVSFEDDSLTYAQLNERANRLAHHLINQGIGPEQTVALALPRSLELVIGVLAVLKAGAAYLPLDPDYPADRLAYTLNDARPAHLITVSPAAPALPQSQVPTLLLDDPQTQAELAGAAAFNPRKTGLRPDNAAYIIYTSGSTGRPKGVVIPHRNVLRLL
ncbi:condensation domain-containing protein, partial [Streptomyces sp. NPDC001552]|uniref:condensation domain-containing protein n=1 Tax=Streptomyces sp. NPDC001552 TaxID=3364587 RepID=UPI0036BCD303